MVTRVSGAHCESTTLVSMLLNRSTAMQQATDDVADNVVGLGQAAREARAKLAVAV